MLIQTFLQKMFVLLAPFTQTVQCGPVAALIRPAVSVEVRGVTRTRPNGSPSEMAVEAVRVSHLGESQIHDCGHVLSTGLSCGTQNTKNVGDNVETVETMQGSGTIYPLRRRSYNPPHNKDSKCHNGVEVKKKGS